MTAYDQELDREKATMAHVQQVLMAVMDTLRDHASFKDDTIRMILADAWDELRMKPTALSPRELEQLDIEVSRFSAQRAFNLNRVEQYEKMLLKPYFARVDFQEQGEQSETIIIGLHSLPSPQGGAPLVHDWRAPVCSLYYDAMPGQARYMSPSGEICGTLWLKRQYRVENGTLIYFVNTDYSIDDGMLLDVLSDATSPRMRQIVSTIQSEQNAAIRRENERVLCVTGGAGSGKTSVAMHRAAYMLYRHRDTLNAERICVISPTHAFSEYISTVLPDLGEDNVRAVTLDRLVEKVIGHGTESSVHQWDQLMSPAGDLRRASVAYKSSAEYVALLDGFIDRVRQFGPDFEDVYLGGKLFITRRELQRMYHDELSILSPAQRLSRISAMLNVRLEEAEKALSRTYEKKLIDNYRDKELTFATRMAVAQKLHPMRAQLKRMLTLNPLDIYAHAMHSAPAELAQAAQQNAAGNVVWREDGPGMAYMAMKLGMKKPDTATLALLVDEAQDYAPAALRFLNAYFPRANVTLLGDPNQRTLPGMPPCDSGQWGAQFGASDAPCLHLSRGYRCTRQIAAYCDGLLAQAAPAENVGRDGAAVAELPFDLDGLRDTLARWQSEGHRRLAVIARTHREARWLSRMVKGSFLLSGEANELEDEGVSIGCVSAMKGLEFDAVAVVWPVDEPRNQDEARRLYTACSRALHALTVFHINNVTI